MGGQKSEKQVSKYKARKVEESVAFIWAQDDLEPHVQWE